MKRLAVITLLIFISFCTANGLSRLRHQTRVRAQAEAEAIGNGGKNLVGEAVGKKSEKIARWEIKSAVQDPGTHKWTYTLVDPAVSFIPPTQVQEDDAEYEIKEVPVTKWYTKFFQGVHITPGTQGVSAKHWLASGPKKVGAHLAHMNELVRVTKASAEEFHVAYSGGAADCIIVLMIGRDSANLIHASRDTLQGDINFPATGGIKAVYLASQVFGKGSDTAWRSGLVRMVFKQLKTKKWLPLVKGVYSSSKLAYNIKTDQVSTEFEASDFKDDPGHEGSPSPSPSPPSPSSPGHGGGELPPVETPKSGSPSTPPKKLSPRKLRESK